MTKGVPAPIKGSDIVVYDYGDYEGAGMDNVSAEEQVTPFLRMAQGLSPELDDGKAEHIPGLTLGSIFNSVTHDFFPGRTGIDGIICYRDHHYAKWIPRDLGGGFRGIVAHNDPLVLDCNKRYGGRFGFPRFKDGMWNVRGVEKDPIRDPETDEEIELVETGQLYVIYGPHGELSPANVSRAIISMTRTALGAYTGWLNRHNNWANPRTGRPFPIFSFMWHITTISEKRNNNEYKNWQFTRLPDGASTPEALIDPKDPLFDMAAGFYELVKGGQVKVAETPVDGDDAPF